MSSDKALNRTTPKKCLEDNKRRSPKDDGMPAFSFVVSESEIHWGISRREYFAAAAVQGLLASGPHDCSYTELAQEAFQIADIMLRGRG